MSFLLHSMEPVDMHSLKKEFKQQLNDRAASGQATDPDHRYHRPLPNNTSIPEPSVKAGNLSIKRGTLGIHQGLDGLPSLSKDSGKKKRAPAAGDFLYFKFFFYLLLLYPT